MLQWNVSQTDDDDSEDSKSIAVNLLSSIWAQMSLN